MNKRKTVFTAVVIGTGIMAVMDRIRLHSKVNDLEERTKAIGRCHNDFCILQERYNKNTDKQIASIQEEIGSVYEHIEELSKDKEDGR
ncbi:conjugal transfer protein [Streptococcus agalactiae]|uniref:conjugal transfer protein n=1 Tax=Streptococcus agalactiae TaxID=1311 RepID=UPI000D6EF90E|nr:conjugal transfer protein [Streptococcus agalactiae]PWT23859.1 conjugal transfer protein [Streptococcus agalactiae]HEN3152414.1 conjugal transfer protein [Streptococcus agalactiae]